MADCRICGSPIREDMKECDNCWEVYSRLRNMKRPLVIKLLLEAGIMALVVGDPPFTPGWAYKCKRCHSLYTKGEIVATTEGFTCPNCGGVDTLTEDI